MNEQLLNRVLHGDCLEWMTQIEDKSIDMILCDLPYGTTSAKWDSIIPLDEMWEEYRRIIKDSGAIVLTSAQPFTTELIKSNVREFRYCWYWSKPYSTGFMNANKMPLRSVEEVCVFYKKLPTYNPQGVIEVNRKQTRKRDKETTIYNDMGLKDGEYTQKYTNYPTQVLSFGREGRTVHPTQKPVSLFEYLIKTYTNEGETVLDNCLGSGTTAVAAINTNRNFIGIEREWEYCEISNKRIDDAKQTKVGD